MKYSTNLSDLVWVKLLFSKYDDICQHFCMQLQLWAIIENVHGGGACNGVS